MIFPTCVIRGSSLFLKVGPTRWLRARSLLFDRIGVSIHRAELKTLESDALFSDAQRFINSLPRQIESYL